jgi:hypothetical protein
MTGKNGERSKELFACHHSRELVRPSHGSEAHDPPRPCPEGSRKTIGTANQDGIDGLRVVASSADIDRPLLARGRIAALVERDEASAGRSRSENGGCLLLASVLGATRARFVDFAKFDAGDADASGVLRHAFEVPSEKLSFWSRFEPADAN